MGKGSRPRPFSVPLDELGKNHETIFGAKPPKERYVPPPLPPEVVEEKPKAQWISGNEETK